MAIVGGRGEPDDESNTVTNSWTHFDPTAMLIFSCCSLVLCGVVGKKQRLRKGRIQTSTLTARYRQSWELFCRSAMKELRVI
jgi:hypothetical protein